MASNQWKYTSGLAVAAGLVAAVTLYALRKKRPSQVYVYASISFSGP
jgi:hypothetical protein